ncbi:MAG: hypothetical protein WC783_04415 [Candidatus Paceibacterota bacterium]|jgi:hypothetical protein
MYFLADGTEATHLFYLKDDIRKKYIRALIIPNPFTFQVSTEVDRSFIIYCNKIARLYRFKIKYYSKDSGISGGFTKNKILMLDSLKQNFKQFIIVFCHEMAHGIQEKLYGSYYLKRTKKVMYKFEKEADNLGYYLYKEYFTDFIILHEPNFKTYASKENKKWLYKYYEV